MDFSLLYTIIGFGLAAYSVIGNDSIQTLGTFLASNKERFKWYTLWFAASVAMSFTLIYGWYFYDGDISYERLTQIPYQEIKWYHAMAPAVLLLLTRIGIPVSTTFLCFISICHHRCIRKNAYKIYGGLRSCGIFRVFHLGTVRAIDR